jgi:hypothetical protein
MAGGAKGEKLDYNYGAIIYTNFVALLMMNLDLRGGRPLFDCSPQGFWLALTGRSSRHREKAIIRRQSSKECLIFEPWRFNV